MLGQREPRSRETSIIALKDAMDRSTRYKVKSPNAEIFTAALQLIEQEAKVLLTNHRRNTISATGIDEGLAERLRGMNAVIVEDTKYSLD